MRAARGEKEPWSGRLLPLGLLALLCLVALVAAALLLLPSEDRQEAEIQVQAPALLSQTPGLSYREEKGVLHDLHYRPAGPSPPVEMTARQVIFRRLDQEHWPPRFGQLSVQGLTVAFLGPDTPRWARRLTGDADFSFRLQPEAENLKITDARFRLDGLGDLALNLSLDKVASTAPLSSLGQAALSTMTLDFTDAGFFAVLLGDLAASEGLPESQLRHQLYALSQFLSAETASPVLREVLSAVRVIAERESDGVMLAVSATPATPYPLQRLRELRGYPLPNLSALNDLNLRVDTH
ncbi:MAG: hypothetical protein AAFY02_13280 [Pseudomonadota bacterium]